MVTEQAKVIAYGVLPMQMETLTAYLHRQGISSMYHSKQILQHIIETDITKKYT